MKLTNFIRVKWLTEVMVDGQECATAIQQVGCKMCVVGHDGKLTQCIKHHRDNILWAKTVEIPDDPIAVVVPAEEADTAELEPVAV